MRPLGLWFWGKAWTLIAWCELRQAFRLFRIDRILDQAPAAAFRHDRAKSLAVALAALEQETLCAPPMRSAAVE